MLPPSLLRLALLLAAVTGYAGPPPPLAACGPWTVRPADADAAALGGRLRRPVPDDPWLRTVAARIQIHTAPPGSLYVFPAAVKRRRWSSAVVIKDERGRVVAARRFAGRTWAPKMVNATALAVLTTVGDTTETHRGGSRGVVWDLATGAVDAVPLGSASHDVEYDAASDSWITAQARMSQVDCSPDDPFLRCPTPTRVPVRWDEVVEYTRAGTALWAWSALAFMRTHAARHGPLPYSAEPSTTGPVEALWEDMSHVNGIALDAVRGIVYVSARNMDTAFALERHSGRLQWSVGRYGSIPSFDAMGQPVPSPFSRAHLFQPLDNETFLAFDNNLMATLPNGSVVVKTAPRSRVVIVRRTPRGMEEVRALWGQRRVVGGGAVALPRGGVLALFSDPPHRLVEVGPGRQVLLNGTVDQGFTYYVSRLYDRPVLEVEPPAPCGHTVQVCGWDVFRRLRPGFGTLRVRAVDPQCELRCTGPKEFISKFELKALWEPGCQWTPVPFGAFQLRLTTPNGLTATRIVRRGCHCPGG